MKIPKTLFNNRQKVSGIYTIKCITSQKQYIGSSTDMYNRLFQHRNKLRKNQHQNQYLQNSYNKNKEENFIIEILEYCNKEELTIREQFYINELNPEYNITKLVIRNNLSKESKDKISKTLKRKYESGEIKSLSIKTIYVYDYTGKYLKKFNSIKECCLELNIHKDSIRRVLKGTYRLCKTYQFSYHYLLKMKKIEIQLNGKAIRRK